MKRITYIFSSLFLVAFTSCTQNEDGDSEFTWLFYALLIGFGVFLIIGMSKDKKEAAKRGISVEELLAEKKQALKQKEMCDGVEVEYLGGYPKWTDTERVIFRIENSNIILSRGDDQFAINKDCIRAISDEKSGERSVGKTAAGAIVGGVLTGGIGLIAGGALGARKKNTSEVFITYQYNDSVELTLKLRTGKNTDKIYAWVNSVFA